MCLYQFSVIFYLVYEHYLEPLLIMAAIKSQVQQSKYMLCNKICFDLKGEDQCQSCVVENEDSLPRSLYTIKM